MSEVPLAGDQEMEGGEQPGQALAQAWRSLDSAREDRRAKRQVARLLSQHPELISVERKDDLRRLLCDPDIDPDDIASAGWNLLFSAQEIGGSRDPAEVAAALEGDSLTPALLSEACVFLPTAERAMSRVRRWLLLSGAWRDYPRLAQGLVEQAGLNGGAWPFEEDERAALARSQNQPFRPAYVRQRLIPSGGSRFPDPVTQAVAENYASWPYPQWRRVTAPEPSTVPREVERRDGGEPSGLPVNAEILVAGCGTGREAALMAKRFPDSQVTAIDISERALAFAAERCNGLGISFHLLDLHEVARLGRRFDLIACSGVLHHLSDPEAGWARLVKVLAPRGVMKIMVYSRVARLRIEAARAHIADLRDKPVDDDLLRAIRRRLIEEAPPFVADFADFYSLSGVHDLLLNKYEDPFDVPRIARGLQRLGLDLLCFKLPTRSDEARYRREHPRDPLLRDLDAWGTLEKTRPFLFSGMYEFWCRAAISRGAARPGTA